MFNVVILRFLANILILMSGGYQSIWCSVKQEYILPVAETFSTRWHNRLGTRRPHEQFHMGCWHCNRFCLIYTLNVSTRHVERMNALRQRQNGRHWADDTFKRIFLNENVWILNKFHWSLFLRAQLIINHDWFRQWLSDEQATGQYLNQWWSSLLTHICVTGPQWFNSFRLRDVYMRREFKHHWFR